METMSTCLMMRGLILTRFSYSYSNFLKKNSHFVLIQLNLCLLTYTEKMAMNTIMICCFDETRTIYKPLESQVRYKCIT